MLQIQKHLRNIRLRHGCKLVTVAEEAGLSPSHLSAIERCWIRLSQRNAEKLQAAFKRLGIKLD